VRLLILRRYFVIVSVSPGIGTELAEPYISNRRKNFGLNTQNDPNSKFSSFSLTLSFFLFLFSLFLKYNMRLKLFLQDNSVQAGRDLNKPTGEKCRNRIQFSGLLNFKTIISISLKSFFSFFIVNDSNYSIYKIIYIKGMFF